MKKFNNLFILFKLILFIAYQKHSLLCLSLNAKIYSKIYFKLLLYLLKIANHLKFIQHQSKFYISVNCIFQIINHNFSQQK